MSNNGMKSLLKENKLRTRKRFGQNFINDEMLLDRIVDTAQISLDDQVLEIGPGMGTLTQKLCDSAKKVVSVEIDRDLVKYLNKEVVSKNSNLTIVEGDFLKFKLKSFIEEYFDNGPIKVVANIPYYITTPIILMLLDMHDCFENIVLMVQDEVADRLESTPGKKAYGSLTIAVNYKAFVNKAFIVEASYFTPPPKINSAIIVLKPHNRYRELQIDEEMLFKIVKKAFSVRRKTMVNALCKDGSFNKEVVRECLDIQGLSQNIRGEALSLEEYMEFTINYIKISKNK